MRLVCPECGAAIDAEQINIQQLAALCIACGAVFGFSAPAGESAKAKRRKFAQPNGLTLRDGDRLQLSFRTNFRLDKDEGFVNNAVMTAVFGFVALLMVVIGAEEGIPFFLLLVFVILALASAYGLALIAWNRSLVTLDDEALSVARVPLPGFNQEQRFPLDDIISFEAEETAASKSEGYDTPRYHVWVRQAGDRRKRVLADLTEAYACFVAGQLNARLRIDAPETASRLSVADTDTSATATSQSDAHDNERSLEDRAGG